jgi:hypothetical protein
MSAKFEWNYEYYYFDSSQQLCIIEIQSYEEALKIYCAHINSIKNKKTNIKIRNHNITFSSHSVQNINGIVQIDDNKYELFGRYKSKLLKNVEIDYTFCNDDNDNKYIITLLWIPKEINDELPNIMLSELNNILSCLIEYNKYSNIHFYVDIDKLTKYSIDILEHTIAIYNTYKNIKIINLNKIFAVQNWSLGLDSVNETQSELFGTELKDFFATDIPIYCRVDFAKLLIIMYEMDLFYKNTDKSKKIYIIYMDLAITDLQISNIDTISDNISDNFNDGIVKLSPVYFFCKSNMRILNDTGVLFGRHHGEILGKKINSPIGSLGFYENRFIIMHSDEFVRSSLLLGIRDLSRHILLFMQHIDKKRLSELFRNIGFTCYRRFFIAYINFFKHNITMSYNNIVLPYVYKDIIEILNNFKQDNLYAITDEHLQQIFVSNHNYHHLDKILQRDENDIHANIIPNLSIEILNPSTKFIVPSTKIDIFNGHASFSSI